MGTKFNDLWNDPNFISEERRKRIDAEVDLIVKLIETRQEKGITQKQLAEMTGIKQSNIARLENLSAIPKIDTLLKILEPLGCTLAIVPKKAELATDVG